MVPPECAGKERLEREAAIAPSSFPLEKLRES